MSTIRIEVPMRQDPNPVPHPRASFEQISPKRDQDPQAQDGQPPPARQSPARRSPAWQPPDRQPSFQPTPYRQAPPIYPAAQRPGLPGQAREDSAYDAYDAYDAYGGYGAFDGYGGFGAAPNDPGVGFATDGSEPRRFQSPWRQDARPAHANGWQGMPKPQAGDQEAEAALATVRMAQRKARRMQTVCVLLGACAAAIFLLAAASHQLDGHIEMMTPVLLLTSSVNFRRYAQRAAKYRAAEADLLARVG
jgi:hypothetical protein